MNSDNRAGARTGPALSEAEVRAEVRAQRQELAAVLVGLSAEDWECRALLETCNDLRAEHTAWAQLRGLVPPGRPGPGRGRAAQ